MLRGSLKNLGHRKKSVIGRNWWVAAIIVVSYLIYSYSIQKKNTVLFELESRRIELEREKIASLEQKEELLLQVDSQKDPTWMEMTLMKGLGLVPEGQRKVVFQHSETE